MNLRMGFAALTIASGALLLGPACAHDRSSTSSSSQPRVHVEASSRDVMVGDTVTVSARTENAYGSDTKIRWRTTGGELRTENSDTMARVTFRKPGTYTVTARVSMKDKETREDSVDIRVREAR